MMESGQMVGLESVAKNALKYLLEHGTQEGVIALVAQLLQLQVQVMQGKKGEEERKKHAAEQAAWGVGPTPAPTVLNERMRQQMLQDAMNWRSDEQRNSAE